LVEHYFEKEKYEDALILVQKAISKEEPFALYAAVDICIQLGKADESLEYARKAMEFYGPSKNAFLVLSQSLAINDLFDDALKIYEQGENYGLDDKAVFKGRLLLETKKYKKALEIFKKAIHNSEEKGIHELLAITYEMLGNKKMAEKHYLSAIEVENTSIWPLADLRIEDGQTINLNQLKNLSPDGELHIKSPYDLKVLVKLLLIEDKFEDAIESFEIGIKSQREVINFYDSEFTHIFILFLAKQQTNLVDKWLREYDLIERFKPLYFALMHLMKDKYPNEYLRMGEEYRETVEEILEQIEVTAEKYK
jgi:tetratricopeptide (TPR) repeat protein